MDSVTISAVILDDHLVVAQGVKAWCESAAHPIRLVDARGDLNRRVTHLQPVRYTIHTLYHDLVWEIDVTLIEGWLMELAQDDYDLLIAALEILRTEGPMLGRPLVDTLTGARHKNMKELRPGSHGRSEIRVLFAFDPRRRAIMLIAGDKSQNWKRWYAVNLPIADDRFDEHLRTMKRAT